MAQRTCVCSPRRLTVLPISCAVMRHLKNDTQAGAFMATWCRTGAILCWKHASEARATNLHSRVPEHTHLAVPELAVMEATPGGAEPPVPRI